MPLDIEVFKEPRGFIRCLEFFFAIVAFSTLANFSTEFSFDIKCKNNTLNDQKIVEKVQVGYPFNIAATKAIDFSERKPCGVSFEDEAEKYSKITFLESFNFSSDAQFYVFVGVVSFLYAGLRLLTTFTSLTKFNPFITSVWRCMFATLTSTWTTLKATPRLTSSSAPSWECSGWRRQLPGPTVSLG